MNDSIPATEGVAFQANSLYEALQHVRDKRKARGKRYSVALVLALSVFAKLGGEDQPEGMAEWVQFRGEPLRASLGVQRETLPSAATYRRVLGAGIDVAELEQVVGAFFARCPGADHQLAIDGKTMRGTIESGQTSGVHLLAVYAVGAGVVLNEVNVALKENEISAAPKVLAAVAVKGKVVTGDAMFTQRDLSQQVVDAGGHYLWKVKDNQPHLRADLERLFGPEKVPLGSAPLRTDFQVATSTTKGHGRLEKYTLTTSALLNATSDWPCLGQVFQLVREVTYLKSGKSTREVWYGVTSFRQLRRRLTGCLISIVTIGPLRTNCTIAAMSPFMKTPAPCGAMPPKPLLCSTILSSACCMCAAFQPLPRPVVALPLCRLRP